MKQKQFEYILADDGGSNSEFDVAILVPVGGTFQHEYGTYRVVAHSERQDGEIVVECERISKD